MNLRILQIGNGQVPFSTESDLRRAWLANGAEVTFIQENEPHAFRRAARDVADHDLVMWTKTDWSPPVDRSDMWRLLLAAERAGVPTVAYHLDLFLGLPRATQVPDHPFFYCDLVCTADGGHEDEWLRLGVNHYWTPPGVDEGALEPAQPSEHYRSEVAFVGSWSSYHPEDDRLALVSFLRRRFGDRLGLWPKPGHPAVRGDDLRTLYASVDVAVGASCLAGKIDRYVSDRLMECGARGAFQVWPHIPGIFPDLYEDGHHLLTFPAGDYEAMAERIEWALGHPTERQAMADAARRRTAERHTYTVRMRELVAVLHDRGLLSKAAA